MKHKTCPLCKCSLDFGEACDCVSAGRGMAKGRSVAPEAALAKDHMLERAMSKMYGNITIQESIRQVQSGFFGGRGCR